MINKLLDFLAKKGLELMLVNNVEEVEAQVIADTASNSIRIKIDNKPSALKVNNVANQFSKKNLDYLMDTPMNFYIRTTVNLQSEEYERIRETGDPLKVKISPTSEFGQKFLKAYARPEPTVEIMGKELPSFDNPRI